ncbi:MAG: hypothetical protein ACOX0H_00125 [Patescibacteria group bacterium]
MALPRLTGVDGGMGVRCNRSELWGTSQSIITTECEYPEVLTALMNYLNEPEMAITTNWGTEGWSYLRREDGVLGFDLDENGVFNVPEGFESWNDVRQNSTPVQGGVTILNEYYDVYAEYTYDAVQLLAFQRDNGKDEVLEEYKDKYVPPVLMNPEEQATYSQVLPQIKNIVRSLYGFLHFGWRCPRKTGRHSSPTWRTQVCRPCWKPFRLHTIVIWLPMKRRSQPQQTDHITEVEISISSVALAAILPEKVRR